jgi:hypothetical protein
VTIVRTKPRTPRRLPRPRTLATLLALAALAPCAALATDYYVRPDGRDSNPGTANTPSGAFATVDKCARTAGAGDRCLIQPGTYLERGIQLASGGRLVRDNANFDGSGDSSLCSCTSESTSVTCNESITGVEPGQYVQCDGGHGFSWTKVASVSGTTIELAEPYRGTTAANDTLDVAEFVEIVGEGATPDDVVITGWHEAPADLSWAKEPGLNCVYSYTKSGKPAPWNAPAAIRSKVPDSEWDLHDDTRNGNDPYMRIEDANDCPCSGYGSAQANIDRAYMSFTQDAEKVYAHTRHCEDPDTLRMQAGDMESYDFLLKVAQDFVIVRNLRFEAGKPSDTPVERDPLAYAIIAGENEDGNEDSLYSEITVATGRFGIVASNGRDLRFEHIRALGSMELPAGVWSGLHFYDVEVRLAQWSADSFRGTSEQDRVVFDRCFVHRMFTRVEGTCNRGYWDCENNEWDGDSKYRGGHGVYIGSIAENRDHSHILVQNSIWEVTFDGWGIFGGSSTEDVIFRNNTSGIRPASHGMNQIIIGSDQSSPMKAKIYNNLFLCSSEHCSLGSIRWYGSQAGIESDHNLFLYHLDSFSGSPRIWGPDETLEVVIDSFGDEQNSIAVCGSGCSGSRGTYYNDGPGNHGLVDVRLQDGDPTDYTPTSEYRGLDLGLNSMCPPEDFHGNKRADGKCDIGAIELVDGSDTTPPAPVTGFDAQPQDGSVALNWVHSSSSDSLGTRVRFRTDRAPADPTEGELVCDVEGSPGSAGSCDHPGLDNGVTYHYAAFSYDRADNHGDPATDTATPSAPSGPPDVENLVRTDTK